MCETMGSVYAIPTGKSEPFIPRTARRELALVMAAGGLIDCAVNESHAPETLPDRVTKPYHSLIAYLDFPIEPNAALREHVKTVKRSPKKPIAIHPTEGTVNLNARSLLKKADPLPKLPDTDFTIASGIRLTAVVEALSPKVAALEVLDMNETLLPGNSIVFITQSRLSPSIPQIKKLRRASVDGLSTRTRKYIESHHISDDDLARCARELFSAGKVSLYIKGELQEFNLASVYELIKTSSKKKRDAFPQLHFFHAMYSKFLDVVAQQSTQESVSAQSLIKYMHEQPELGIAIPTELNDVLAEEVFAESRGSTVSVEVMAAMLKKVPASIIALSPTLQLFEVMIASAGYTLYSQEESPIESEDYVVDGGENYVATASAWPDLVVGAVNKTSGTWIEMVRMEREHALRRSGKVDDSLVEQRLQKRLQKLFSGHMLNFSTMKKIDISILHAFLSGLALDIPETQLILYERKAKLMVDERNVALAPHNVLNTGTTGSIEPQRRLFKDGMSIQDKNEQLPGIRDSAFAVAQILHLYDNLRQISSLTDQEHPHLDWRNAIALRGTIMHVPLFKQATDRGFMYIPGNKYGIEMVDHASFISNGDLANVTAQVGQTLAERMAARKKKKNARAMRNATPLRKVA